jgi:murein DD-endopeptidase MepM/ murein hydrolase activator NlpD
MLSAVTDLYQLLTFSEVMQEISVRDTEIMDEMKQAKDALEQAKAELEAEKAELEEQKSELDTKNSQMSAKQSSLNSSLSEANLSYEEAKAAQSEAQAALDSDEMNYEAVQKEIQKLIAAAAAAQSKLTFTGFTCPLKTYTRISDEYGYRTNPVTGVYKLHGGIDFAAPKGTPIYAAASGYVTVAGWNSSGYGNYVIIYHGEMSDGVAYSTLYAHMSSIAVTQGTAVAQGQVIGYVGSTGNSTGNHLHLEVWQGRSSASRVDPRKYIPIA